MKHEIKMIGDFEIHPVGIGTWLVGGGPDKDGNIVADTSDDEKVITALRYSLEMGQNHIDTGQIFGGGHTEELIGKAIRGFPRSDIFISSKVWKSHGAREKVREAVDIILKRLDTDYLDMLSVHKVWPEIPLEETVRGINDAIDEGTVRNIGVNNLSLKQLKRACEVSKHPVRAAQIHYSLWYKDDLSDEMRSYCEEKKITVVAFKPLERCRKLADGVPGILREMADKYDRSIHQVALNWIIRQKNMVTIPKALNPDHIKDNIEAAEFNISDADWKKLSEYPGFNQG